MKRTSKTVLALAAATTAALFASGCSTMCGEVHEAVVKCAGANVCKGSGQCATPDNSCKGHNACKGNGWAYMSRTECVSAGGTVID